ncbi:MAG: peptide deformylase [Ruminococcaceae bacterium]|nr:peptide deformylase [Oscillospiraceae bacterium]
MAIRNIRKAGDEVLIKKCREVTVIDDRVIQLLEDMKETMYEANGVGLAAPQVGILKRIAVIDVGDGPIELINPVIVETEGEQCGTEGCLSAPGKYGEVIRPEKVTVTATDRNGDNFKITGEGLLAVALCHEIDHLDGNLFLDKVIRFVEVEQ